MFVEYGRLTLRVIDMTRFDRETVWSSDGTTLIGVDTTLGWICTLAPGGSPPLDSAAALSPDTIAHLYGTDTTRTVIERTPRGSAPGVEAAFPAPLLETTPGAVRGVVDRRLERTGPETDAEIRNHLWIPRQRLILWAYDRQTGAPIRWLESPRPRFVTDVANGPIPLSVDVVSVSGEPNSVAIHFQIATRMSPCPTGSDRLVLSHRWQMTHGHDQDHYLTRTIDGEVVFNGAVLRATGIKPDDIRRQFIHPIPLGFRRQPPDVIQSSDGLTIRYKVVDTDPTIIFDSADSGATNVQIAERLLYQNPTTWNGDAGRGRDD